MPTPDPEAQVAAMPFRVYGLEGTVRTQDAAIDRLRATTTRHSEAISAQAVTLAMHDEKLMAGRAEITEVKIDVCRLANSVEALAEKISSSTTKVAWTLTGVAFTVAGSAIMLALTGHTPA